MAARASLLACLYREGFKGVWPRSLAVALGLGGGCWVEDLFEPARRCFNVYPSAWTPLPGQ